MRHRSSSVRVAAVSALVCLSGCFTSKYKIGIVVDPQVASVFINGKKVGTGAPRVYEVDFGGCDRVFVQAAAAGFEPKTEEFTREMVLDQMDKYKGEFKLNLKEEK